MDFLWYTSAFIVAIGVLVTVHEYGHFWVARRLGVKVLRFSVGFGRALWSRRVGPDQIEYVVAVVPLGGYVKMLDEREGDVDPQDRHRAFNRQTLWVRTAVVLAGPMANFLFAIFAYWVMFVIGVSGPKPLIGEVAPDSMAAAAGLASGQRLVSVDGRSAPTWEAVIQDIIGAALKGGAVIVGVEDSAGNLKSVELDLSSVVLDDLTQGRFWSALGIEPERPRLAAVIGQVESGSPAARSGLTPGDTVVAANGEEIADWPAWVDYVRAHPEVALSVEVQRAGVTLVLELTPAAIQDAGQTIGRIGAGVQSQPELVERYYTTTRYGVLKSASMAFVKTWETSTLTLRMFWKMVTLEVSLENLSGPITIAQYAGYSAKIGLAKFIEFLAIVSISLGILNLLPIPILDGGHLLYYFIELFKGRPVSEEAQFVGQRFGIAMLFGLMGLAFYNDLTRLFG